MASTLTTEFTAPATTRDSISRHDLLDLELRARAAGDAELADYIARAHDQRSARHRGLDCDVDILDECVRLLNEQQAIIDAAFARADQLTQELLAERNSFAERKSWRGVLVGGR